MSDDPEKAGENPPPHEKAEKEKIPLTPEQLRQAAEILKRIERTRGSIKRAEGPAKWLDKRFLDPAIGALGEIFGVDWLGDIVMSGAAIYFVGEGLHSGLPAGKIVRMLANYGIDLLVDLVPALGSIFDALYHANVRNVDILKEYAKELEKRHGDIIEGKGQPARK